jgi:amino acid transporter
VALLEYVRRGFGDGHVTGVIAWLLLGVHAIITGMVAVSFGSYASDAATDGSAGWTKAFAALVVVVMALLNALGSQAVARVQTVVVVVVLGILTLFAVVTLADLDADLLAFSGYPPLRDVVSSVALTFFAFLGFGVITFTAKDLRDPARQLPRAVYLALGIATTIYVAVALGVFGTLTVDEVIDSGGTALAVAAEPALGRAGWLMTVTALFATAGATNSGLYPAAGLSEQMAGTGQFPPLLGRRLGGRAPVGLLVTGAIAIVLAVGFDLTSIASIGSAVALVVFALVTVGHLRVHEATGGRPALLVLAIGTTVVVLVTFAFTTLVDEPGTAAALVAILLLSIALDAIWKRSAHARPATVRASGVGTTLVRRRPPSGSKERPRCASSRPKATGAPGATGARGATGAA